jgi:hypothetical protein
MRHRHANTRRARRVIPWDAELPPLDEARRARLVFAWRWRMEQEHLAVGAFSELARDLAEVGCDSVVLSLVTRAAADEVRHADICRRVAEVHGRVALPSALRGAPQRGRYGGALDEAVLFRVVEMCCLSETFTAAYFTEMLDHATHPLGRAVVQSLLEDEIDHGRVGWAYLASVRARGGLAPLGTKLPELVEATVKPVMDEARESPEGDDPATDAHGYLGRTRGADIYRRALRDVVLPGFDAIGIDTREARALAASAEWL